LILQYIVKIILNFQTDINFQLDKVYSSADTIRVIKSRRMKRAGVWHECGRGEVHTGFWWENLKERDHLEDLGMMGA
jgi:hypothetical protein